MKEATLTGKQVKKLISIFEDMPIDRAQTLLESGLLADLRNVEDISKINREEFQQFIGLKPAVSPTTITITVDPNRPLVRDMHKEGWKIIRDLHFGSGDFTLELAEFLKPGENQVKGTEMAERAREVGTNLGQRHAEMTLVNRQMIPKEWRKYYLLFPGTIWQDLKGDILVALLRWDGSQWNLEFERLSEEFGSYARLLKYAQ